MSSSWAFQWRTAYLHCEQSPALCSSPPGAARPNTAGASERVGPSGVCRSQSLRDWTVWTSDHSSHLRHKCAQARRPEVIPPAPHPPPSTPRQPAVWFSSQVPQEKAVTCGFSEALWERRSVSFPGTGLAPLPGPAPVPGFPAVWSEPRWRVPQGPPVHLPVVLLCSVIRPLHRSVSRG